MNNLFFWIIILSFVIPMAMRMYRKSVARRNHEQSFSGRYPEQFPGAGQYPADGQFPGSNGPQSKQPRDGFTQQDYFAGGYRQIEQPQPIDNPQPLPYQYGQMPQPLPYQYGQMPQPLPYQYGQMPQPPMPGQDNRGFPQSNPPQPAPEQAAAPATPPPPSAPQGFRARKLAELDQQYSNGELSVEEYMARRSEIMNG